MHVVYQIALFFSLLLLFRTLDIQGVQKKERHFKYICKIANNYYLFLKIKLLTHNYICRQMSKYKVSILNIH